MIKMNARTLRTTPPDPEAAKLLPKNPVYIICDNILDTYNVGSIFRLSDAVAASRVYLCGVTETPPNTRIKKASINTWQWVDWKYAKTTPEAIAELRAEVPGIKIVAVEQAEGSVPFYTVSYDFPVAFIVGNETTGVTPEVLSLADTVVELPMWGVNVSLNVMVTLGIVLYDAMRFSEGAVRAK